MVERIGTGIGVSTVRQRKPLRVGEDQEVVNLIRRQVRYTSPISDIDDVDSRLLQGYAYDKRGWNESEMEFMRTIG